jgi:hypothetical protein
MQRYRLVCDPFWVDVRLREFNGRWIASADTVRGPTLGCGTTAFEAVWEALAPFGGLIGPLLASLPADAGDGEHDTAAATDPQG